MFRGAVVGVVPEELREQLLVPGQRESALFSVVVLKKKTELIYEQGNSCALEFEGEFRGSKQISTCFKF